ncbi:MAG: acyl-N-acyltransferase [Trebouxia sp. A1-2]|nr:MAG: acyl-N-acyltransferase [Trebouxia sp. A1-2]
MYSFSARSDAEPEASIRRQDQEASTSGQEQEQGAILVGTVELLFAASTRARYLTLNAPVNCAYLCNMAVDANYRRRGYGNILLDAADDVAKLAGETQIYLHLRFQDAAPASLYKQAGYVPDKADSFLLTQATINSSSTAHCQPKACEETLPERLSPTVWILRAGERAN